LLRENTHILQNVFTPLKNVLAVNIFLISVGGNYMAKRKFFCVMLAVVLVFGLVTIGCASTTQYVRTDPFQIEDSTEGTVIARINSSGTVDFNNKNGDNLKINGVAITSNEFSLPAATSYEFKFRVSTVNRGIIGNLNRIVGRTNVMYPFEYGKTYLINIEEATESKIGASVFGAFIPASYKVALYEYPVDLKEKGVIKLVEFPVEKLKNNEF
jgi:hypothetical protein